jgi:hypothetical protein
MLEIGLINFIETATTRKKNRSKAYSTHNELYRQFNACFKYDDIARVLGKYRTMENSKRFKLIWLLSQFSFTNTGGAK